MVQYVSDNKYVMTIFRCTNNQWVFFFQNKVTRTPKYRVAPNGFQIKDQKNINSSHHFVSVVESKTKGNKSNCRGTDLFTTHCIGARENVF